MRSSARLALVLCGVTMSVAAARPLAAQPGPLQDILLLDRAHVGKRIHLRAAPQLLGGQLEIHWELRERPVTSKARLDQHRLEETSFFADVPGSYEIELTVRRHSLSRTAALAVAVTEADPLVPVNTIEIGDAGTQMRVGSQVYPDPGRGSGLHVVTLLRSTLALVQSGNQSFPLTSNGISSLNTYLAGLTNSYLVLISLPSSAGPVPSSLVASLDTALANIGAVLPKQWTLANGEGCWTSNTQACPTGNAWTATTPTIGSFSVIGVKGLAVGKAWFDSAAQRYGWQEGALIGYLTPATNLASPDSDVYGFVFPKDQYLMVDTCASGAPNACVIRVGDETYPPAYGANGVNLVLLDRVTGHTLGSHTVTDWSTLSNDLYFAGQFQTEPGYTVGGSQKLDRVIVVMQTVGTGIPQNPVNSPFLQIVDRLGGTPETIAPALQQGQPYALIGVASNLPWHGTAIESSPLIADSQTGHARAALARDRMARYTPQSGDPTDLANLDLFPFIYQDKTPWPYEGSCAIPYIAAGLHINADIRGNYSNHNVVYDSKDPHDVSYPTTAQACTPFPSPTEYAAIQDRLKLEFDWVTGVRAFIQNLKSPYSENQLSPSLIVDQVSQDIAQTIPPPPTAMTTLDWVDIFVQGATVAGRFLPGSAKVMGLVSTAGKLAQLTLQDKSGSGGPVEKLYAQAQDLKNTLNDQYLAHLASLGRLEAIVVADAGKLEGVGTNASANNDWRWDTNATSNTAYLLNRATKQSLYAALLPTVWGLYNLKPDLKTQFSSANVATYACGTIKNAEYSYPFAPALEDNQFHARFQLLPAQEASTQEVWAFSQGSFDSLPTKSLTSTLFAADDTGTGAYKPAWYRETYNPPGYVICGLDGPHSGLVPPVSLGPSAANATRG